MKTKAHLLKSLFLTLTILLVGVSCSEEPFSESEEALLSVTAKGQKKGKLNFTTSLKGSNEVPAVDTKAAGHVSVKISKDETSLYYKITAANLDNVSAAHFHVAPTGVNGGVVAFLFSNPDQPSGPQNGVLAEGSITEADLIGTLAGNFAGLIEAIRTGNVYVNVHSTDFPSGELRGQL